MHNKQVGSERFKLDMWNFWIEKPQIHSLRNTQCFQTLVSVVSAKKATLLPQIPEKGDFKNTQIYPYRKSGRNVAVKS